MTVALQFLYLWEPKLHYICILIILCYFLFNFPQHNYITASKLLLYHITQCQQHYVKFTKIYIKMNVAGLCY
jgi:hypothetical protein